jgi:hypothetical protein
MAMRRAGTIALVVVASASMGLSTVTPSASAHPANAQIRALHTTAANPYFVYWDQNEEEDFASMPAGTQGQLVPPYNPNGQMCLIPGGGGSFVTAYNPTTDPTNPGFYKTQMQPPIGEAIWDRNGNFTGQTIYVPGPYMLPGQTVGGDIPPDGTGNFNNDGTFTGCAFDHHGNLFASDIGTAQGQFPAPDDGRLIEWFGPSLTSYCIIDGPDQGGVGTHNVNGTGGLTQPGDLAVAPNGDLLVPEAGSAKSGGFIGKVLRLWHRSLPRSPSDCGTSGVYQRSKLHITWFVKGKSSFLPFPQSIARDPACHCWAVATTIGNPAIAWFDDRGRRLRGMGAVPGESFIQIGEPNGYNPFGLVFAPDGTAYFADIHIVCSAPLVNCGPANNGGQIMKVTITNGLPDLPVAIAGGYNFPTSVIVCLPSPTVICPQPVPPGTASRQGANRTVARR